MKSFVLVSMIALLGMQSLWAQSYHPFPDSNAAWCDEQYDNGWPYSNYYYFFYKTNGKSTINDTVYTIISDNYEQVKCFLREENKKVYCRLSPELSEFILYDFDINTGDTVILHNIYGESFDGYVEETDSLLIGDHYHRRYFIQCPEWLSFNITEGIGSDAGLFYYDLPWVDIYGTLYCFSLNDTIYKTDGSGEEESGHCWQYIGVPETNREELTVYPNPARDYIYVSNKDDCSLELVDLSGRRIRYSVSDFIYVGDLEQGIYLLRIYSLSGTLLYQQKVIKLQAL